MFVLKLLNKNKEEFYYNKDYQLLRKEEKTIKILKTFAIKQNAKEKTCSELI